MDRATDLVTEDGVDEAMLVDPADAGLVSRGRLTHGYPTPPVVRLRLVPTAASPVASALDVTRSDADAASRLGW